MLPVLGPTTSGRQKLCPKSPTGLETVGWLSTPFSFFLQQVPGLDLLYGREDECKETYVSQSSGLIGVHPSDPSPRCDEGVGSSFLTSWPR